MPADTVAARLGFIRVVLSRPQDSANVGAVCRAMKNMGLKRLYIAGFPGLDREKARVLALHASDILENAVTTDTFDGAVEGCSFIAGLTCRWGRLRKYVHIDPPELAHRLMAFDGAEAAVVFGNEVSGLSDEELNRCHVAVTIPSSREFPSLNLSHAVQVVGYEVYRAFHSAAGEMLNTPISGEKLEALAGHVVKSLKSIGFFKLVTPEEMGRFFRDIFARAALSDRESQRIMMIFSKVAGMAGKRNTEGADR